MARPLRICYKNATYHVMNRGLNRRKIFLNEHHYRFFIDLLKDVVKKWDVQIHAFSLMPNHYHLLIQTPLANISRVMRHIDGVYTQRFNRSQKRDGPLFRGRYKAILVEEDAYLVELLRYIHLNPVKGELVLRAEDYIWSGHRGYVRSLKGWDWLTTERLLQFFGDDLRTARRNLKRFIEEGVPEALEKRLDSNRWPSVLSSRSFQELVEWNFVKDLRNPKLMYVPPRPSRIKEAVLKKILCEHLETSWAEIREPKGLTDRQNRAIALAFYDQELGLTYKEMSKRFLGISESGVSRAVRRIQENPPDICEIISKDIQNSRFKS